MESTCQLVTRASMDDLTPLLFDHLIARVIDLQPSTAISLLCLSSRFFSSACKAIYEETAFQDDHRSLTRPASRSRIEALIRYPAKYSKFVRTITVTPKPVVPEILDETSYFSFQPKIRIKPLTNTQLLDFVSTLEGLEAFIWSTDRVMPSELCSSLSRVTPSLSILSIRPLLNLESSNQSQSQSPISHPNFSTSPQLAHPFYSIPMGSMGTPPASSLTDQPIGSPASETDSMDALPSRSDLVGISSFLCLRELTVSCLSMEGARNLTLAVPYLQHLEHIILDFTFVEDSLLMNIAETCDKLQSICVKTSGTKTTDKSILSLLESCDSLNTLNLAEVEGRLTKKLWSKLSILSNNFEVLKVSFSEIGNHHSWVTDHLTSIFEIFQASMVGLKGFSVCRIYSLPEFETGGNGNGNGNGGGHGLSHLGLGIQIQSPPQIPQNQDQINTPSALGLYSVGGNKTQEGFDGGLLPPCNEHVTPRPLPREGLEALQEFGKSLQTLELDFWSISLEELKIILESCSNVEELKVLVDATLGKIISAVTSSSRLTFLRAWTISITDNNVEKTTICLAPTTSQTLLPGGGTTHKLTSGDANQRIPRARKTRSSSIQSIPDLSPSSTMSHLSGPDLDENPTPANSPIQERVARRRKKSVGDEVIGSNLVSDAGVPTKRDIKKLAKRCPSLKTIRWIGRGAKGEWSISGGGNQIDFFPIGSVPIQTGSINDPTTFDPSLARRRTSGTASLRERPPVSVNALLEGGVENPGPFLVGGPLDPDLYLTSSKGRDKGKGKSKSRAEYTDQQKLNRDGKSGNTNVSGSLASVSISPESSPRLGRRDSHPIQTQNQNQNQRENQAQSQAQSHGQPQPPAQSRNNRTRKSSTSTSHHDIAFANAQLEQSARQEQEESGFKAVTYRNKGRQDKGGGKEAHPVDDSRKYGDLTSKGAGERASSKDRKSSSPSTSPQDSISGSAPIAIPGASGSRAGRYIPGAPESARSGSANSSPPQSISRSISRSPDERRELTTEEKAFAKRSDSGPSVRSWSAANAAGTSHINARGRKTKPLSKMTSKGGAAVGANSGGGSGGKKKQ